MDPDDKSTSEEQAEQFRCPGATVFGLRVRRAV